MSSKQASMNKRYLVVTTINPPNKILHSLAEGCSAHKIPFIIVGDTKSPPGFAIEGARYYGIEDQLREFPTMAKQLPTAHYTRKNIGYLLAIRDGACEIQETDDDNIPYESFWRSAAEGQSVEKLSCDDNWYNVYRQFTEHKTWPRGFALSKVKQQPAFRIENTHVEGHIFQGLADQNPDVDALYRLTCELPVDFEQRAPLMLAPGVWCPFNSQNTIFKKSAFPLLYLPSYCSFRMTDIWRSFVAQRCLWELGESVVFHNSTVYQERNEHDLLKDFADEVPGYLQNERIAGLLEKCSLDAGDMYSNLIICYETLIKHDIVGAQEYELVTQWCAELQRLA